MNEIGETAKNVILRKVKSGQLVVHSPLEIFEAITKFIPSIHSVYLPKNENIFEPEDISMARKLIKCWKYISWKENVFKMTILKSIFSKLPNMKILFTCSGMEARMKSLVESSESDDECAKWQGSNNDGEE